MFKVWLACDQGGGRCAWVLLYCEQQTHKTIIIYKRNVIHLEYKNKATREDEIAKRFPKYYLLYNNEKMNGKNTRIEGQAKREDWMIKR